ncbi:hypothetical protein [Defluviimonas sp. WL0075]|uniref:C-type lysozyme inhibitor domain-containing protein n=1 Tax=Albidovulum sediminicola TaxID=2984331 RepID=A0ABT2Z3G0_9RHOB|nr:hypothetical protein [Defluviimonas sp. WL0075]MCV2865680.1 hypothetical protein [Defluviimonas sp. WL0075]
MKYLFLSAGILLPLSAEAGNIVFDCSGESALAAVQLVQYEGQDKGQVLSEGAEIEADVHPGTKGLFFVVIGDGFTQNYALNTETGELHYTGTGSKTGYVQGTCTPAQG